MPAEIRSWEKQSSDPAMRAHTPISPTDAAIKGVSCRSSLTR
jgi:hypothetical protein